MKGTRASIKQHQIWSRDLACLTFHILARLRRVLRTIPMLRIFNTFQISLQGRSPQFEDLKIKLKLPKLTGIHLTTLTSVKISQWLLHDTQLILALVLNINILQRSKVMINPRKLPSVGSGFDYCAISIQISPNRTRLESKHQFFPAKVLLHGILGVRMWTSDSHHWQATYDAVHMPTAHMSTDGCEALSATHIQTHTHTQTQRHTQTTHRHTQITDIHTHTQPHRSHTQISRHTRTHTHTH